MTMIPNEFVIYVSKNDPIVGERRFSVGLKCVRFVYKQQCYSIHWQTRLKKDVRSVYSEYCQRMQTRLDGWGTPNQAVVSNFWLWTSGSPSPAD